MPSKRTGAERQRRYIQRLKAKAAGVSDTPSATPVSDAVSDALKKENADLKSALQWANSEKDRLWRELGEAAAANTKLRSRKGVFTSQQFNFLRACLHPERNFSDEKLTQMRQFLESLENVLVKPRK